MINLDDFWRALETFFQQTFGWLDSHGISVTIAGHLWEITFLKATLTFAFLCFFFMLFFPHFYIEDE